VAIWMWLSQRLWAMLSPQLPQQLSRTNLISIEKPTPELSGVFLWL
jgi:hypothetical protein